jgi:hypothetical protein
MTTHTLARILKQLSEILLKLPDSNIEKSMFNLLEILSDELSVKKETETAPLATKAENRNLENDQNEVDWENLIKSLKESDLNDANMIIENANINTVAMLSELAKRLNINLSGRPKKENIIHIILKSLERDRLDETIRSRGKMKDTE